MGNAQTRAALEEVLTATALAGKGRTNDRRALAVPLGAHATEMRRPMNRDH